MKLTLKNILLIIAICFSAKMYGQKNESKAIAVTEDIINQFKAEEYERIYDRGDSIIKRRITKDRLQNIWESLATINGELKENGIPKYDFLDTMHLTTTKLKYKNGAVGLRLAFNLNWELAGLFIIDAEPMYNIPAYANTFGFYEIKIPFGPEGFEGEAILTVPIAEKKYPCVIIIGGSGPVDKDLTLGPNRIYKDFAWGLANKGVASLRFDKRTKLYWSKIMEQHQTGKYYTIEQEYLEDINTLVKKLSKKTQINPNRIFLMGHSQGAGLMPLLIKQNKKVAGGIMLAGNYSSMTDLMLYQFDYLQAIQAKSKEDSTQFDKLRNQALQAQKLPLPNTMPDDKLPQRYPFSYWNYLSKLNLPQLALKNNKPVLILQGVRDYQVPFSEYQKWQTLLKEKPNYMFASFEKLNHLFLEGIGKSTPTEYFNRSNVPEYVIDEIVKWINAQPR